MVRQFLMGGVISICNIMIHCSGHDGSGPGITSDGR